jgi:hypothetical protein
MKKSNDRAPAGDREVPRRLGHVLDGFRIAAAARSMARRNHCFLAVCRVEASGTPIFCPEMPLASFPRLCGAAIPAMFQRGNGSGEALRSS